MLRTPAGRAFLPARDRRIYIVWIALIWLGMAAGFLPDLARYMGEKPAPPLILHIHGMVYFLWLASISLQIALIELRKPALHRRLGWWVVGLSAAIVPLGLVAAMVDMVREAAYQPYEPQFLALEFQSMVVFAILLTLGVRRRRDLAAHKRLMILMAVCIMDPGSARAWGFFSPIQMAGPFGFWLHYFWADAAMVAALMIWDRWHHGRVHPALWTGGAIIATGEAAAVWLQFAPWWNLASTRLVEAWGWGG